MTQAGQLNMEDDLGERERNKKLHVRSKTIVYEHYVFIKANTRVDTVVLGSTNISL